MSSSSVPRVVPAQLSFLALYNPALGTSDETVQDQIVFYYNKQAVKKFKHHGHSPDATAALREQKNEQLRQVGLAQGMVGFARSFSNGEPVDSIETERSRIVLYELEPNWWILASIDLTQLPAASSAQKANDASPGPSPPTVEYSSREVSPPALLIKQLVRANATFLLHHGPSLEALFRKLGRAKFCNALDRFWTKFASHWEVLLHESPAVDIFHGMKLAAGGELGIGVGEEEWGSGEREVLEEYARRTDGLVDVMVSRFGEPSEYQPNGSQATKDLKDVPVSELEPWIGRGKHVNAGDGVVFSGVGALSRSSLRDLSNWVEDIYTFGDYAYGVKDSPTADRRKRRRRTPDQQSERPQARSQKQQSSETAFRLEMPPRVPRPIVTAAEASLDKASKAVTAKGGVTPKADPTPMSLDDTEGWMKYLTLGYGTTWGGKKPPNPPADAKTPRDSSPEPSMRYVEPEPDVDRLEERLRAQIQQENSGYFIIGLKGSLEDGDSTGEDDESEWNVRIPLRTVHVEVVNEAPVTPGTDDEHKMPTYLKALTKPKLKQRTARLRPVVYVHRPFIYTFLFSQRTDALTFSAFYRNLHTYFAPLHKPLSSSTAPCRVHDRVSAASHPYTTISSSSNDRLSAQPIYDIVYDPRTLTVHSNVPNIPEPGHAIAPDLAGMSRLPSWTRIEALNVHSQILATVASTRRTFSEIERTCKTSRGWWVVWMRLPPSSQDPPSPVSELESDSSSKDGSEGKNATKDIGFRVADLREAFLIRRSDGQEKVQSGQSSGGSGMWRLGMGLSGQSTEQKMGGREAGWGPRGLSEGIGIDARRYVEGLLSLNR